MIRFGLQIPRLDHPRSLRLGLFERLVEVAEEAEASGFDSLWAMDHLILSNGETAVATPEAYTMLGGLVGGRGRSSLAPSSRPSPSGRPHC